MFPPSALSTKTVAAPPPHAPLRVRQAFGRVPAPAPFRGRRCPACGFRLRPCLEPPLNRPDTVRFPGSALRGGMRGRFPLPHPGAGGTVPAGPRLDALRAVPLSGYPARNAPVPLRSGRQAPACARFAALQPGAFGSLALLAVRQDAPVGVDVEPVRPLPEAMLIACRWFSAPEIRWIAASDDRDRAFRVVGSAAKPSSRPRAKALGGLWTASRSTHAAIRSVWTGRPSRNALPLAGHVAAVACETLFPSC